MFPAFSVMPNQNRTINAHIPDLVKKASCILLNIWIVIASEKIGRYIKSQNLNPLLLYPLSDKLEFSLHIHSAPIFQGTGAEKHKVIWCVPVGKHSRKALAEHCFVDFCFDH